MQLFCLYNYIELKGTLEFIELYRVVPEASIDKSWPKLDENPSEEDIEYLKQARILSKTSPDVDFQVFSYML